MNIIAIERDFATRLSYRMEMCTDHARGVEVRYNFKCPLCGDGDSGYKTRGWLYEDDGHVRFGCFNCGRNFKLTNYLYDHEPEMYREFAKEKFSNKDDSWVSVEKPKPKPVEIIKKNVIPYSTCIADLPENHPAVKWVANRKIPKHQYHLFFFTDEWKKLANNIKPETYLYDDKKEYRLVIPIYNKDGTYSSLQGRALDPNVDKSRRYLTIKADDKASKVYGMERADPNKTVWMLEGPIDSVFIPNACAIVGGVMALEDAPFPEKRVWVLDKEDRSYDTIKRIENLVHAGERVVIWDECPWQSKDINDMVKNDGARIEDIISYLKEHTYYGLRAELALSKWRRFGHKRI
ncbi:DNA primase [Aeromonas phage 65]|uniref:DNA primase n=2 Tax=Ishigurovirus osborne TaxID=260149 RepID=A0A219YCH2_9CAUD|nr:DNA primase [Aeromonas phage 65]AAR90927.1 DNA primase [Aeromonas phage 65]APU01403.1 DNA primase [Aeromonas phage 65.2]